MRNVLIPLGSEQTAKEWGGGADWGDRGKTERRN